MARYVFKRVGNPLIGLFCIVLIIIAGWLYTNIHKDPTQFSYSMAEDGIIIHHYAYPHCSQENLSNGLIIHSEKRCRNTHNGTYYHWEDLANHKAKIVFCVECMDSYLTQEYIDSIASYR